MVIENSVKAVYQTLNNFLVKTSGLSLAEDDSIKTLMLLHGWGMNSHVWEPIKKALESQYHLIWVDLPGHGFNRHIEAQSLENMVDLISEVTPDNTHLIGWSLGGLVAQCLTQKISHRIKSMTLVTSTPRFSQSEKGDWPHAMSDDVLNRFAENLKQDTEKTLKGFIALQFIGVRDGKQAQDKLINHILYNRKTAVANNGDISELSVSKDETASSLNKWGGVIFDSVSSDDSGVVIDEKITYENSNNNIPTQVALDTGLAILKHADLRNVIASCPEHWLFAEYDLLIPKEVINDLISLRPDAEITLLEKAGHAPFITQSDIFLSHVIRFIETLD